MKGAAARNRDHSLRHTYAEQSRLGLIMRDGPKRGSGKRTGLYARSKLSNWTPFDPYFSEVRGALNRDLKPALCIETLQLPIYELPLHPEFLRTCTPNEVAEVLSIVPQSFLSGLRGVYLLGGTSKQARNSGASSFQFGSYCRARIFLTAFPRNRLAFVNSRPLRPSTAQEYARAGARIQECHGGYTVEFDEGSLRRFYLHDVLLHEIGHHADERAFSRPNRDAERYAEWFVQEQARRRREEESSQ